MLVYIVLFAYTIYTAYVYSKYRCNTDKNNNSIYSLNRINKRKFIADMCFGAMITPSVLVSGLRYGISVDYIGVYNRNFKKILNGAADKVEFEPGFVFFSKCLGYIHHSPEFLFLSYSLITIFLFFVSFKESKNYVISVILFFGTGAYFDSFNGLRQYIVVAIFLYCFKYIKAEKWKNYFIIMGLACLIHSSAIFTLPLYFLKNVTLNKYKFIPVLSIIFICRNHIFDFMIFIMSKIPKYNYYIMRQTVNNQVEFSASGLIMSIIALTVCILAEKQMISKTMGRFFYNISCVGLALAVCSSFLPFAERIMYYTRNSFIFVIPYACSLISFGKFINTKFVQNVAVGTMCTLNFIGIAVLDWYAVLPYKTIFSK